MTSLEVCRLRSDHKAYLALQGSASDRETPLITVVNGTLMARRSGAGRWWLVGVRPLRGSLRFSAGTRLVLVRPDMYVGLSVALDDAGRLPEYLGYWYRQSVCR